MGLNFPFPTKTVVMAEEFSSGDWVGFRNTPWLKTWISEAMGYDFLGYSKVDYAKDTRPLGNLETSNRRTVAHDLFDDTYTRDLDSPDLLVHSTPNGVETSAMASTGK